MRHTLCLMIMVLWCNPLLQAQTEQRMQQVCTQAQLPGLAWVHCNADSVFSQGALGYRRMGAAAKLELTQPMRIGSLTKWLSTMVLEKAVSDGLLSWNTRFFEVFPQWKSEALAPYHRLQLAHLVAMQSGLPTYTYTHAQPAPGSFTGTAHERRLQFLQWCFRQTPVGRPGKDYQFCNPAFVAAVAMYEARSSISYRQAIAQWLEPLHIVPQWGQPNASDSAAVWGHTGSGVPEAPAQPEALEWLDPAGNLCMSPRDLGRCVQEWLKAAKGQSAWISARRVKQILQHRSGFHGGWFCVQSASGARYLRHLGNPGSFLCLVQISVAKHEAVVLMTNIQNPGATEALHRLALEVLE